VYRARTNGEIINDSANEFIALHELCPLTFLANTLIRVGHVGQTMLYILIIKNQQAFIAVNCYSDRGVPFYLYPREMKGLLYFHNL